MLITTATASLYPYPGKVVGLVGAYTAVVRAQITVDGGLADFGCVEFPRDRALKFWLESGQSVLLRLIDSTFLGSEVYMLGLPMAMHLAALKGEGKRTVTPDSENYGH